MERLVYPILQLSWTRLLVLHLTPTLGFIRDLPTFLRLITVLCLLLQPVLHLLQNLFPIPLPGHQAMEQQTAPRTVQLLAVLPQGQTQKTPERSCVCL